MRTVSGTKRIFARSIALNRMEVAVHTSSEQYPAPQTSHDSLYVGTDGQPCDKLYGLGVDGDVESNREK
jgi:hypothetical protein